jgi:hypothetical protein
VHFFTLWVYDGDEESHLVWVGDSAGKLRVSLVELLVGSEAAGAGAAVAVASQALSFADSRRWRVYSLPLE